MFELEQQVESWKNQLLTEPMRPEDVEELASHLYSTIDELVETGLSAEEAFYIGQHRLGGNQLINAEYLKVNSAHVWRKRFIWLISGYFLFSSIPMIVDFFSATIFVYEVDALLFSGYYLFGSDYSIPFSIPIPIFAIAFLTLSGVLFYFMSEKSGLNKKPVQHHFNNRIAIGVLTLYVAATALKFGTTFVLSSMIDIDMVTWGNFAAAGSLFSMMWQLFLILSVLVTFWAMRRGRNKSVYI